MKYTSLIIMGSALVLAACGSTTYHVNGPEPNISVEKAGSQLVGRTVALTGTDSIWLKVPIQHLAGDSLVVSRETPESTKAMFQMRVSQIVAPASTGWKIVGGVLGFILGYASGIIIASAVTGGFDRTISPVAMWGILLGSAVAGTIVGVNSPGESSHMFSPPLQGYVYDYSSSDRKTDYVLQFDSLLEETPSSVTIPWKGALRVLPKNQIGIERQKDGKYVLRVPKELLGE